MRNVWETKKRKMKISSSVMDNIPKKKLPEAGDYNLPETLGCLPKEVKSKVMDGCFAPVRSMISHALNQLGAEGLPKISTARAQPRVLLRSRLSGVTIELRASLWRQMLPPMQTLTRRAVIKRLISSSLWTTV